MRDMVAAEDRGLPTVTLTVDDLRQMSTDQAVALGVPGAPVVALGEALYGRSRADIASVAEPHGHRVEAGLMA